MRAYNDYMTSSTITLTPHQPGYALDYSGLAVVLPASTANIRRRMRKWRTIIPRTVAAYANMDNPRFRDVYIRLLFTYDNSTNYKFVLHDLITTYTISELN
jgi:hypothetical protein